MSSIHKGFLLDWDEYNSRVISAKIPYIFSITRKDGRHLLYFGARHSFNKENPQFDSLRAEWRNFLNKASSKNCLVLIEGGKRKLWGNEEESIQRGGEGGLITFLAAREGVETKSPEASRGYIFNELAKNFSREHIIYLRVAEMVVQWNRVVGKQDFPAYLASYLEGDQKDSGWMDFDFSFENIRSIHRKLFHQEFNETDREFFYTVSAPNKQVCVINEVSRADCFLRDIHIVKEIVRYWSEGKNLFIVFGFGHAIMQEPALKALLV